MRQSVARAFPFPVQALPVVLSLLFGFSTAGREAAAGSRGEDTVRIAAVGDIMLSRSVARWSRKAGDYGYPFRKIDGLFKTCDLAFCNLECALTRNDSQVHKGFTFKAHPESARHLKEAGFTVVSLANNHAVDFGEKGFRDTLSCLERQGLLAAGVQDGNGIQAPVLSNVRTVCIGWLAYCEREIDPYFSRTGSGQAPVAIYDSRRMQEEIRIVRAAVDVLVVSLHFGREYSSVPTRSQARMVREAVTSGASVVLGHHQHAVQGIEMRGKTLVAHGLGNFVFDQKTPERNQSILLEIEVGKSGIRRAVVRPIVLSEGQPSLASGEKGIAILEEVSRLSAALGTKLVIGSGGDGSPVAELSL